MVGEPPRPTLNLVRGLAPRGPESLATSEGGSTLVVSVDAGITRECVSWGESDHVTGNWRAIDRSERAVAKSTDDLRLPPRSQYLLRPR